MTLPSIHVHDEVDAALRSGRPVVALESAVVSVGLPRNPLDRPLKHGPDGWDPSRPANLQLALAMTRAVRAAGAIPAMTAVIDGVLHIGLDDEQVEAFALRDDAGKASSGNLAATMAAGGAAGTTVSATLTCCGLPEAGPIQFFATGGLGGVHRHWASRLDVSADLGALAASPVCVVCSGVKSILDIPATLEALEAMAVPVAGYQTSEFPLFLSRGVASMPAPQRVDDIAGVVRLCRTQWETLERRSGVVIANPAPEAAAVSWEEVDRIVRLTEAGGGRSPGNGGASRTPALLSELVRQTGGRSVDANIALLCANAALAAQCAVCAVEG